MLLNLPNGAKSGRTELILRGGNFIHSSLESTRVRLYRVSRANRGGSRRIYMARNTAFGLFGSGVAELRGGVAIYTRIRSKKVIKVAPLASN